MRFVKLLALLLAIAAVGTATAPPVSAQPVGAVQRNREKNWVTDFGARGDGTTDDTAAIQACVAANWNKEVILPPGNYRTTAPIVLKSPDGTQGNCSLKAVGLGWDVGSTTYPNTNVPKGSVKITADFKQGDAIVVAGNLNVKIVGIEIEGVNNAPPGDDPNGGAYGSTITDKESDWISGVTVSAAVDEGSTWLITTSTAHGYSTGDDIDLLDMKGLTPTKYTADEITKVSSTQFRINADPFSGTYSASSGKATDIGCGRYNPYAGIAIDPGVGTKPTGGYDNIDYGQPISRWVWIENCVIRQFAVGIAVSPANTTLNADGVTIKDSLLTRNMYNVSVGHSNIKGLKIDNCDLNTALTAVEGLTHGSRTGYPPQIVGGSIYLCYNMFHLSTQYGAFSWTGGYSEHCQMIGYFGHAAAGLSKVATLTGCVFDLGDYTPGITATTDEGSTRLYTTSGPHGLESGQDVTFSTMGGLSPSGAVGENITVVSATTFRCADDFTGTYTSGGRCSAIAMNDSPVHLVTFTPTVFTGCTFYLPTGCLNIAGYYDNYTTLTNCSIRGGLELIDWNEGPFIACNWSNLKPRVRMIDCSYTDDTWTPVTNPFLGLSREVTLGAGAMPSRIDLAPQAKAVLSDDGPHNIRRSIDASDESANAIELAASSYSFSGDKLTFTAATPEKFAVGDVIAWPTIAMPLASGFDFRPAVLKVTSIVSSTVTCVCLCDPDKLDQTFAPASVGIFYRPFVHGTPSLGDITVSSATIANVASAASYWKVGDWIAGPGIPSKARVTAVGSTSLTISNAATTSWTQAHIYNDRLCANDGAVWGDRAPPRGRWSVGDMVRNIAQSPGSISGWICSTGGTVPAFRTMYGDNTIDYFDTLKFLGPSDSDDGVYMKYDTNGLHLKNSTTDFRVTPLFSQALTGGFLMSSAPTTKADGATTIDMTHLNYVNVFDSAPTNLNTFTCEVGQIFSLKFGNSNTTIVHTSALVMPRGANYTAQDGDVLVFQCRVANQVTCIAGPWNNLESSQPNVTINGSGAVDATRVRTVTFAHGSAQPITDFTIKKYQEINVIFTNGNTTLKHDPAKIICKSGADIVGAANGVRRFIAVADNVISEL